LYRAQHDIKRADAVLAEVEPRLRKDLPPGHYAFAVLTSDHSLVELERGNNALALQLANQALDELNATIKSGKAGINILPLLYQRRGTVELQSGNADPAADDFDKALELLKTTTTPGTLSYRTGRAYLFLARARKAQGREDDARFAAKLAAENLESSVGSDHPDTHAARQLGGLDPS
jgi:tetratricopeptide (TPR) repeat protein